MKKQYHYILMIITLLLVIGCGGLIPKVHVNSDMTAYLPDDSPMKQGIAIISDNFSTEHLNSANVKVMFHQLDETQRREIAVELSEREEVQGVSYEVSSDSAYTLYALLVSPSIDQKALGYTIKQTYEQLDVVVETSQDGATPPLSALIIAGALILIILVVMAQSWVEPLIYLIVIGVAVVINMGTNAFLPSVSITTNYIVAILQLVLSLDYAIVLSNRFRQELHHESSLIDAMNRAIRGSYPAIISSAMTTVVGLAMLAFMRVKIGLDLGVVLGKGVLCSLITTFTMLPAMLMLFHSLIVRTSKKTFVIPTDRLGRFATHHKISLTISAVVLFGLAFYYSRQTDIYFNTNSSSEIEEIFPNPNTLVMVYSTEDDESVITLADSLRQDSCIEAVISYPTLLLQSYTAPQLVQYISQMSRDMADYMPPMEMDMLTPEMMQMVYYMRSQAADTLHISFPDMMQFVRVKCMNNPLFADLLSDDLREQMVLFDSFVQTTQSDDKGGLVDDQETESATTAQKETKPVPVTSQKNMVTSVPDGIPIRNFMPKLYAALGDDLSKELMNLTDATQLTTQKTVDEMADFIGSSTSQTKMVYNLSQKAKQMTPMEYVHFLTDDVFHRKVMSKLVSDDQKQALILREQLMDAAYADMAWSPEQLTQSLQRVGLSVSQEQVLAIAYPVTADSTVAMTADSMAAEVTIEPLPMPKPQVQNRPRRKSKEERQAEQFDQLMYDGKKYTCDEMTEQLHNLDQSVDSSALKMLYCYYGSVNAYPDSMTMTPEQLLTYVADTLVKMNMVAAIMDSASIDLIDTTRAQLSQAMDMLSHEDYSLFILMTNLPAEAKETYDFIERMGQLSQSSLSHPSYLVGESVMFSELKHGFTQEMTFITLLTILAIFVIVAITFRSIIVPTILVMTVMTAVYVNVVVSGWISGQMLYLAYLIVQSILMGATIDYGILYANYYKEYRRTMEKYDAAREAYHGSVRTITTSGLIMVVGPGVMAVLISDVTIQAIVGCISIGALMAILLILFVLPGVLVAFDKLVVSKKVTGVQHK